MQVKPAHHMDLAQLQHMLIKVTTGMEYFVLAVNDESWNFDFQKLVFEYLQIYLIINFQLINRNKFIVEHMKITRKWMISRKPTFLRQGKNC